jgi:cyclophilin family peptidyl-prolyl cis-trans isomerase
VLKQLTEAYPDIVQVTYRHFPLNSIHANAQISSEAAEAAGAQGAFWPYHDLLFETQGQWAGLDNAAVIDFFVGLAEELALDGDQLRADLENGTYAAYVSAMEEESINIGLGGTPSVIFNGELITGGLPPYQIWDAIVQLELLTDRQYDAPPELTIDVEKSYLATVALESGDTFTIELLPGSAPETVNSFVFLANEGWFDNVMFHRVIPGFVAQTGDPTGTGYGGPGYTIPDEIDADLTMGDVGVVAMANSGPDTSGSQWFITLADASRLDGGFTIFGRVVEGMDVVNGIPQRDPADPAAPPGEMISSVSIEEE